MLYSTGTTPGDPHYTVPASGALRPFARVLPRDSEHPPWTASPFVLGLPLTPAHADAPPSLAPVVAPPRLHRAPGKKKNDKR